MPSGSDEGAARFADAWGQQEGDRRSPLGPARRSANGNAGAAGPDEPTMRTPALDHELRGELDLAAALREAARSVPGPDPAASARMRASLLEAIGGPSSPAGHDDQQGRVLDGAGSAGGRGAGRAAPRPTRGGTRPGEGRPERRTDGAVTGHAARPGGGRRRRTRTGRILNNVLTGTCVVMLLGALTVVMSRGALPDETLYGVKRASESVEMGLTTGQEAKGRKHLEFAALRLEEVSGLIERGSVTAAGTGPTASGLDPERAALVGDNLREFDEQARAGSRMMLPLSGRPSGPDPSEVGQWAQEQSTRLQTLSPSLSGEDRAAAASSQALLDRLSTRASALDERRSCPEVSTGTDELGPLPSEARCEGLGEAPATAPETSAPSTTTTTTSTTVPSPTTDGSTPTTTDRETTTDERTQSETTTGERTERTTPPPVQVPLPLPLLPPVEVPPLIPGLPGISLG